MRIQISVVEVPGCKIKVNVVELLAPVPYLLGSCYCFYFLSCFHIFMSCFAFSVRLYGRFGWILICHSAILRKHIQGKKYWVTRMEKKIIGIFGSFPSSELLLISLKLVSECVLSYLYICFSVESRALDVILRILRWHSICFCRKGLKFSFFLIAALRERLNNRAGWCRVLKGWQQVWTRRSLVLH